MYIGRYCNLFGLLVCLFVGQEMDPHESGASWAYSSYETITGNPNVGIQCIILQPVQDPYLGKRHHR